MEEAEVDRLILKPTARRRLGKYVLLGRLGHGGMGSVFRAHRADGQYEQQAAIKLLNPALVSDEAEMGCAAIDMGGGTTTISVFSEGKLVHADAIALGGQLPQDLDRTGLTPDVSDQRPGAGTGQCAAGALRRAGDRRLCHALRQT